MLKEYIRHLLHLLELEREEEKKRAIEEIRSLSGPERERAGRAVLGLSGRVVSRTPKRVVVRFGRGREVETDIEPGDIVLVSNGRPLEKGFEGTVVERGKRYISVEFERLPAINLRNVRIDLFVNDTTFRRMEENLLRLSGSGAMALRLMLGEAETEDHGEVEFTPLDRNLNPSQLRAVSRALAQDDFFLIHGPFGTGKTRTVVEYIRQEVSRGRKVLATADSNTAVDNLVERLHGKLKVVRLGHPSRIEPHLVETSVFSLMRSHERYREVEEIWRQAEELMLRRDRETKPAPRFRRGLSDEEILRLAEKGIRNYRGVSGAVIKSMARWIKLNEEVSELVERATKIEQEIIDELVSEADVVLSTNSTSFLLDARFDVAVVDEATQSTIPSVLIPISRAEKFVLAGDHRQLPPTVVSQQAKELERTMFEALISRHPFKSEMLNVQYRMNEILAEFPSKVFYGGRLKTDRSVASTSLKDVGVRARDKLVETMVSNPLVFIDTSDSERRFERRKKSSTSIFNEYEARVVRSVVERLIDAGVDAGRIGVISPYDDQVRLLRKLLKCEVKTVDGYQGREKDVIVISMVRSNKEGRVGFLEDERRFNVSITRARRLLVVIGDSSTLSSHRLYRQFFEHVKERGVVFSSSSVLKD
ncbi:DNA helicase, putative [Geoglobus ahangari]|uniref:DNA helicase, putative n=1 Tax=Geoglobus ahangari TaxID=113653 RepID=A0A0F7IJP0_9EURY|nr:IGHMBP2 family helicase [Geoglobus ahangari]AKG92444.1 DNA helicase, putative [Geoglobus ahangari]